MSKSIEPTLVKSTLVGTLISIMLFLTFVPPASAYWQAEPYANWDNAINYQKRTWGVQAILQALPGDVYWPDGVNSMLWVEFYPTPNGRNAIEIGWAKAWNWGGIRWFIAWLQDGVYGVSIRDYIEYASWHSYRLFNDRPINYWWWAGFDGVNYMYFPWDFGGGYILVAGEIDIHFWYSQIDGMIANVEYYYDYTWTLWDRAIVDSDPPYYCAQIYPYYFEVYGPA